MRIEEEEWACPVEKRDSNGAAV
ncbi:hypothetical protein GBAR_LOCUS25920 [Geodia barretti]|uniref:Uncharacterized protein n=1 Tax=Geodia barretti TaxID=519541 RepID=A0AA35XC18_GEOBA|nr:hypothetical protein GBAR_LOCUS25920 [Geodia barretti]